MSNVQLSLISAVLRFEVGDQSAETCRVTPCEANRVSDNGAKSPYQTRPRPHLKRKLYDLPYN